MKRELILRMSGYSEVHLGDSDKPNEDAYLIKPALGLAVVADGVTRSRDGKGNYPSNSTLAPRFLVEAMERSVSGSPNVSGPETLRAGMALANTAIGQANLETGISSNLDFRACDYLGTTGLAVLIRQEGQQIWAHFAYIGDPLLFHARPMKEASLLTRDQLENCHLFGKPVFERLAKAKGWSRQEAASRRLLWQRRDVRNNRQAKDTQGNMLGFGVLTGEARAMGFVETGSIEVEPGDRLVLSSDAIRACRNGDGVESAGLYWELFRKCGHLPVRECAKLLVEATRHAENEQGIRSDDATVIVIDVQCSTTDGG